MNLFDRLYDVAITIILTIGNLVIVVMVIHHWHVSAWLGIIEAMVFGFLSVLVWSECIRMWKA
jgi:hypothetical protein